MHSKLILISFVVCLMILTSSANLSVANDTANSQIPIQNATVIQENGAILSGNVSYYTDSGNTTSGSTTIYSTDYTVQWYFTGEPVASNLSSEYKSMFQVGDYGYAGGGVNIPMVFEPGIDSSGGFNIGTIYATLNVSSVNSGILLSSSTWSEKVNLNLSSPGWSDWTPDTYMWAYIQPTFTPDVPEGFYSFSLSVSASPSTSYAKGSPGNLFTTPDTSSSSGGGFIATNESIILHASTNVMMGVTFSGQSASSNINLEGAYGANVSFKSIYPIELEVDKRTSKETPSGYVYFNSSSPIYSTSLTFQNVQFPANGTVTEFSIQWNTSDVMMKSELKNDNFTSMAQITNIGHWWNTTNPGGSNYSFRLISPSKALNGKKLDGTRWNTTWSFEVFNLVDSGFGSPVNNFYINFAQVPYPYKYNQVSGSVIDSGGNTYTYVNYSTENLVYSYPSFGPPTITSANSTPNPVQTGKITNFWAYVNWDGQTGNLSWEVGNTQLTNNSYIFNTPGKYEVNATANNEYGTSILSFNVTVYVLPDIENVGSSPTNITTGVSVNFSAFVDWYGINGTVLWQVNGVNLSGHTYTFDSPGTYKISVIAQNKYGNVSKSFYVDIRGQNPLTSSIAVIIYSAIGLSTIGICLGFIVSRRLRR